MIDKGYIEKFQAKISNNDKIINVKIYFLILSNIFSVSA